MATDKGDLTGQTLGNCQLEKLIGQGGMGAVYLARQLRPTRHVAVKVLLPNLAMDSQTKQEFLARFRREADVIAKLEHVNIMPIYEYGEQEGMAYLVMPYLTGGSLRDVLRRQGVLSLTEAASYIDQTASALDYAHAQGVIHRDLKPANFLLHADGRLVLADFGIARMMEESAPGSGLTTTGALLGTPEYMAPEMAQGEPVDYRADIYELGVVLFQMLSGHVPFTGSSAVAMVVKHIQEPLPLLHQERPQIPPAVDAVIQKATAKRREERYTTAKEMAQALRRAMTAPDGYRTFPGNNQDSIPTIRSASTPPIVLPAPAQVPQYETPPQQRQLDTRPAQTGGSNAEYPAPGSYQPVYPENVASPQRGYQPVYPEYQTPPPVRRGGVPWWAALILFLIVALIAGGLFEAIQISRRGQVNTPSPTAASGSTPQATTQVTPTSAPGNTPTTVPSPAATPTTAPSPTVPPTATAPATLPTGAQIYAAPSPGPNCDTGGGQWAAYNGAQVTCQGNKTQLSNTSQKPSVEGIFLTQIPGQSYPTNYVAQVQVQQGQAAGDFGIYFRNQPGQQLGAYTFIVHPDGTWSAYVYDNNTGAATQMAGGTIGNVHASVTLAVVANGQQFSFYANGHLLGTASDQSYTSGTAGLVVGQGASVTVRNFTLYATAS